VLDKPSDREDGREEGYSLQLDFKITKANETQPALEIKFLYRCFNKETKTFCSSEGKTHDIK
jgi:hypothetical protein